MDISVRIKELVSATSPTEDHYSVVAILELVKDGVAIAEKEIKGITCYRYESETLKKAVEARLMEVGKVWRNQYIRSSKVEEELQSLEGVNLV